ncbi:MAG: ORF6N domain-containing protein [Ruminococcus sp.]|nr:ORF6N domain-containing protein [Ruminococcus sp.]
MYELINNVSLKIKEYNGQRVVTFKDIDTVHNRPEGTARKRFNDNRKHFIEGEDYFKVCASEIRTNKIMDISPKTQRDVILVTLSGYLMLVKSFTDDLAWSVQRQLVNTYFRVQEINNFYNEDIYKRLEVLENKIDSVYKETKKLNKKTENIIVNSVSETAKSLVPYFDTLMKVIQNLLKSK